MNILEKLKNMPMGTRLWSPAFGYVVLDKIDEDDQYPITIKFNNRKLGEWERDSLSHEGRFDDFDGSKCIIFPSKLMTDWSRFFQPGDVVQRVGGSQDAPMMLCFERWLNDDYTTFAGRRYSEDGYGSIYKARTKDYQCAAKEDADRFYKAIRERQKEEERDAPKQPFKPFDKVLVRDNDFYPWHIELFGRYDKDEPTCPYTCLTACYAQCIPYEGNEHLLSTTHSPSNDKEDE